MSRRRRALVASGPIGALLGAALVVTPASTVQARSVVHTRAEEVTGPIEGTQVRALPFPARHVALYWSGNPDARVTVAFTGDGVRFGAPVDAERDEVGAQRGDGRTYGAVLSAAGATSVRVSTDRPLGRLTVLAMSEGATSVMETSVPANPAGAVLPLAPAEVATRSEWGADESLRFRGKGPIWPPVFQTVQKLVVHHTAGTNNESGAAALATIRAIYRYHAVTQGWGDIGYNFLIDAAGRVYKGRSTSSTMVDDDRTGENGQAKGVTAGHAYGYNSGTTGVALLGNFDLEPPTTAAADALQRFLTWKAGAHGLDATGSSQYTNPLNGTQVSFPNAPGHQQVPDNSTACPGVHLAALLPDIRAAVRASAGSPDTAPPAAPSDVSAASVRRSVSLSWTPVVDTGSGGGISGTAGYDVFRQAGGTTTRLGTSTGPAYTDASPPKGGAAYYVQAYDGAGNRSGNSNTVSAS
jgi:hypothetical protein